jgi:hypothetical protein
MTISHYIQPSILVLIGFSFLFAMLFVLLEYINLRALKKSQKKSQSLNNTKKTMTEGVSVIIYADNDYLYGYVAPTQYEVLKSVHNLDSRLESYSHSLCRYIEKNSNLITDADTRLLIKIKLK